MNARENIKPKSIRLSILLALSDGAITTIDDLQTRTDQPRGKLVSNLGPTVSDELIKRMRDEVTNAPAYQITESGRQYLAKYAGEHGADEPEQPAAAAPAPEPAPAPAAPISLIRQKDGRDREIESLRGQLCRIGLMLGIDTPLRSDGQEIEQSVAEVLHKLAAQPQACAYVVQRPAKPLVRFNKIDNAQARAMVFARGGKATKVFALVPVGTAIPGAEWRNA